MHLPRSRSSGQYSCGFSLLELLIVLVIIAIMYGIVSASMQLGFADPVTDSLKQLGAQVRLVRNESVIRSSVLGLYFDANGYRTMELVEPEVWQDVTSDRLLERQEMDESLQFELLLDGLSIVLDPYQEPSELDAIALNEEAPKYKPQVVILPTGEMTPFMVTIQTKQPDSMRSLKWDNLGRIVDEETEALLP